MGLKRDDEQMESRKKIDRPLPPEAKGTCQKELILP